MISLQGESNFRCCLGHYSHLFVQRPISCASDIHPAELLVNKPGEIRADITLPSPRSFELLVGVLSYKIFSGLTASACRTSTSPRFVGRLTHRGELSPSQFISIRVKLLVSHPGNYVLSGWTTETEVGEPLGASEASPRWLSRQRYRQPPLIDSHCYITVVDDSST